MSTQSEWIDYTRKSNGRKAVPRQKALIAQMIAAEGGRSTASFSDRDSTAFAKAGDARPKRDDFDRMIALLGSREGLRIGAYHADRLLRNTEDTATLIRVCVAGAHLIQTYAGGVYDLSTANGRRRLRDDASAAEYEVDHGRERVLAAKDERAALGLWGGGKRPFGWEPEPRPLLDGEPWVDEDGEPVKGVLRLVGAEADALREACDAALAGAAVSAIARQWNAAGLTGPLGAHWNGERVRRVLMRARNAGLAEHRGQIAGRASWSAIVTEDTWRAVCAKLADPARVTSPGPARRHLLSGIALCGTCGSVLGRSSKGGEQGPRTVYACRAREGDAAAHVARDAATLDAYIAYLVKGRMKRPDAARLLKADSAGELARLHRDRAELQGLMTASNDLRRAGLLTPEEFTAERRGHIERMADLDGRIAAAADTDILARMIGDPEAAWKAFTLDEKRAAVTALMTVTVHPQPKGRPKGWKPGDPYFDPEKVGIEWVRRLPSDG